MARKTILAILIPVFAYGVLFGCIYIYNTFMIRHHEKLENSISSTDLSSFSMGGYKLGQTFEFYSGDNISITTDDGEYYSGSIDPSDIKNKDSKIIMLSAYSASTYPPVLAYEGRIMPSYDDCLKALGGNYVKGIPYLGETGTIFFIDRKNDIKIIFSSSEEDWSVYVQRINDKTYQTAASPVLEDIRDPISVCIMFIISLGLNFYFNPVNYYTLPIYFLLITWPITLLIALFETKLRIPLIVINVLLFVLYGYIFFKNIINVVLSA